MRPIVAGGLCGNERSVDSGGAQCSIGKYCSGGAPRGSIRCFTPESGIDTNQIRRGLSAAPAARHAQTGIANAHGPKNAPAIVAWPYIAASEVARIGIAASNQHWRELSRRFWRLKAYHGKCHRQLEKYVSSNRKQKREAKQMADF